MGHDVNTREVGSDEDRPVAEWGERSGGDGERRGVAIDAEKPSRGAAPFEDRRGVSSRANGAVDVAAAVLGEEFPDGLVDEDGDVLDRIAGGRGLRASDESVIARSRAL